MRMRLSPSCMAFFARITESLQYLMIYFVSLYRKIRPLSALAHDGYVQKLHS